MPIQAYGPLLEVDFEPFIASQMSPATKIAIPNMIKIIPGRVLLLIILIRKKISV